MKWFAGIGLASLLIFVPAVGNAQTPVDAKMDTQKAADAWMEAYNNKDAAALANMYAEDAVYSNQDWTASGRAAIGEGFKKQIGADVVKINSITVDQAQRVGDLSYSWGAWTANAKTPDGKEVPVQGHWTVVSRCYDADCIILNHNSNMAAPPAQ